MFLCRYLSGGMNLSSLLSEVLLEKCPNTDFFWSVFSCIRTEYGDLRSKFPHSARMQKIMDQKILRIRTLFAHLDAGVMYIFEMFVDNCEFFKITVMTLMSVSKKEPVSTIPNLTLLLTRIAAPPPFHRGLTLYVIV